MFHSPAFVLLSAFFFFFFGLFNLIGIICAYNQLRGNVQHNDPMTIKEYLSGFVLGLGGYALVVLIPIYLTYQYREISPRDMEHVNEWVLEMPEIKDEIVQAMDDDMMSWQEYDDIYQNMRNIRYANNLAKQKHKLIKEAIK